MNIAAILEEAGISLDRVVSAAVVLAEEDDFAGMNEECLKWFPTSPARRQASGEGFGTEGVHCGYRRGVRITKAKCPVCGASNWCCGRLWHRG
jgi:enamine deaminase RidA (YjgF/YER057c/UK114 family)